MRCKHTLAGIAAALAFVVLQPLCAQQTAPAEPIGVTSPTQSATLTFTAPGILANIAVLTLGAPNLDFNATSGSSCALGTTYLTGQTCTVSFTFAPTLPGLRQGGITLTDINGNLLASTLLAATGNGPQLVFSPVTQKNLPPAFSNTSGIAIDGAGNLFIAAESPNILAEVFAAGGYTAVLPLAVANGNFQSVRSVAIDGNGNLFVADTLGHVVKEVLAAGGYTTVLTLPAVHPTTLYPQGLAVDAAGNIFLASSNTTSNPSAAISEVLEITAASGYTTVNTLGSGFSGPSSVAVDAHGDVFVGSLEDNFVREILAVNGSIPANPTIVKIDTNLTYQYYLPFAVALDSDANLFVGDSVGSVVYEVSAASNYTQATLLSKNLSFPLSLILDGGGNIFITDTANNRLVELDAVDPPTLSFAATNIGSTSSDSPQTVTLSNNGNQPLLFTIPSLGNNPTISPSFNLASASTCPLLDPLSTSGSLAATASCTYAVNFTPDVSGPIAGELIPTDNNLNIPNATQIIHLNAAGQVALPSTATLSSAPNPSADGASVTLTATVASSPAGGVTPTGTVTFYSNGASLGASPLSAGLASFATTTLDAGTDILTCTYSGDLVYAPSACPPLNQTVNPKPATLITTTDTPNPSLYGQPVVFTAHVAAAAANASTPTGYVLFTFCHGATVRSTLDANANVTFTTPLPGAVSDPAGACPYTASYQGDNIFASSTSAITDFTVLPAASTTTLAVQPNPAYIAQPVTLTATVQGIPSPTLGPGGVILPPGAQTPTGQLQFFADGNLLGTAAIANGIATLTTTSLTGGAHSLTAVYPGDANLTGSSSSPVSETIILPDFTLAATPPSFSIPTGHRGSIPLTFTSLSGFTGPITVTCGQLPPYATCYPPSLSLAANGTATATLTLDTNGSPYFYGALASPTSRTTPRTTLATLVPLTALVPLTLLTLTLPFTRRRRNLTRALSLTLLATLALTLTACAGHYPATTPPGAYTLNLTATGTSTNLTQPTIHTLNLTLTVTPQ
jgi:hypothetical protein